MKQRKHIVKDARGTSLIVVGAYACLLLATVFTGAYLYLNKLVPAPTSTLRTYTDTARVYTLAYPSDWTLTYDPSEGAEGLAPAEDWSYVSRGYTLADPYAPKGSQGVSVHIDEGDIVSSIIEGVTQNLDKFHTLQKLHINGHEVYYDKVDYIGPSGAEKYTDHYYYILNGNILVTLTFREKYYHNYPYDNWDDGQDLATFQDIVYSVKFL